MPCFCRHLLTVCGAGERPTGDLCSSCPADTYSPEGIECLPCPAGFTTNGQVLPLSIFGWQWCSHCEAAGCVISAYAQFFVCQL